jgi:hypothetical protein
MFGRDRKRPSATLYDALQPATPAISHNAQKRCSEPVVPGHKACRRPAILRQAAVLHGSWRIERCGLPRAVSLQTRRVSRRDTEAR